MDDEPLPQFRYHPDPVATGMIGPSKGSCAVCGLDRGLAYMATAYGQHDVEEGGICPWCIASGAAARELGAAFVDDYPLVEAGLPEAIVREVCERTPGYISWQQEQWLVHCGDACEYHGDATQGDVADASPETRAAWDHLNPEGPSWDEVLGGFDPRTSTVGVYKFICRHCRLVLFHWDMT